jgi:hypothetical protein
MAATRAVERGGPTAGGHAQDRPLGRRYGPHQHISRGEAVERKDADLGAIGTSDDMDEDTAPVVGDRPAERGG